MRKLMCVVIFLVLLTGIASAGYDFSKIKNSVSEFTLPNGLKFILLEDHSVPIATFYTYVNAGSSDERIGILGISHVLEHMAFKGTSEIGTSDAKAEQEVLKKMDTLFDRILAEKDSLNPDQNKIKEMEKEMAKLDQEASKYVVQNEYDTILRKNGSVNSNAGTSNDSTVYNCSLPSNRLELWAYLESSRLMDPVFREFYREREIIKEERRVRTENQPIGKLLEELLAISFKVHPYHFLAVGPMSNLAHIRRQEVYDYFNTNYNAGNMVIGISGDIYPDQLKKIAEKYFARLKPGKRNPRIFSAEPPQTCEKTVTLYEESQPWLILAYHCPADSHEDFIKFKILDNILTSSRSSRLNKRMVIDNKLALGVFSIPGLPGSKYPALYLVAGIPNSGHTTTELVDVIDSEIEKIKTESVSEEEMESAKTRIKVQLINGMKSNDGLLVNLLGSEINSGSWKKAFDKIDEVEKITASDIRELVKKYLVKTNRTVGRVEKKEEVKK
jgi:predicted Zn-dependent peptidase